MVGGRARLHPIFRPAVRHCVRRGRRQRFGSQGGHPARASLPIGEVDRHVGRGRAAGSPGDLHGAAILAAARRRHGGSHGPCADLGWCVGTRPPDIPPSRPSRPRSLDIARD